MGRPVVYAKWRDHLEVCHIVEREVELCNTVVNVPASTRALICFTRQRINHICCDREALGHAGGGIDVSGQTITGTLRDIQHKGRFEYNSIAYRDVIEDISSGARDPRVIAEATEAMSGTTVPDTTPYALTQLQCQLWRR